MPAESGQQRRGTNSASWRVSAALKNERASAAAAAAAAAAAVSAQALVFQK